MTTQDIYLKQNASILLYVPKMTQVCFLQLLLPNSSKDGIHRIVDGKRYEYKSIMNASCNINTNIHLPGASPNQSRAGEATIIAPSKITSEFEESTSSINTNIHLLGASPNQSRAGEATIIVFEVRYPHLVDFENIELNIMFGDVVVERRARIELCTVIDEPYFTPIFANNEARWYKFPVIVPRPQATANHIVPLTLLDILTHCVDSDATFTYLARYRERSDSMEENQPKQKESKHK